MSPASTLHAAAVALADQGTPVFPCAASKAPLTENGFHDATLDPRESDFADAALLGVPTGAASAIDVIDIDPRHGGDVWLAANAHRLPVTRTHRTQSGGLHILLRARPDMRCSVSRVAPGVDVRADGGYVVWWPATGLAVQNPDDLADWPDWLIEDARGSRIRHADNPKRSAADLTPPSAEAVVALLDRMPNPDDATRDDYIRVMMAAVGCAAGLDGDGEQEIGEAAIAWACRWSGSPGLEAEAEKWDSDFSQRDAPLAGWQNLLAAATRFGVDCTSERAASAAAEFGTAISVAPQGPLVAQPMGNPHWKSKLLLSKKDEVIGGLANLMLALRESPAWAGVLAYDDFRSQATLVTPPPWHRGTFAPHQAVDGDFVRAAEWAAVEGITVSSSVAAEAMHAIAEESRYHPVRDYLRALTWDGVARADTWLVDFLGAADTPLNRAFASKFLIAAVARVMRPGCQVDTMLVLEGRQGLRKSTALRILAGEEHFTDHSPDIGSKDAAQQLQGIWLMEQAELATLGRADKNRVKEFISRRTDRFRPSYGRVARDFPRQCVFAATLNPGGSGYLADDTGARRFWPVLCGVGWPGRREVDSLALAGARDQLWAEAVARYDAGEPWWLADSALQADQEAATADRFDFDVWTDRVRGIVGDDEFVQTPDILERLGLKASDQNRGGQMRVAGILTALGWKAARQPRNGVQTRGYVRPDGWQPAAIAPAVDLADFL